MFLYILYTLLFKGLGSVRFSNVSYSLHHARLKTNAVNSNIVNYYNASNCFVYIFSNVIYSCEFLASLVQSNNYNILIWCSRNISSYDNC